MEINLKIPSINIPELDLKVNYSCLKTRASCFLKGIRIPVPGNDILSSPQASYFYVP